MAVEKILIELGMTKKESSLTVGNNKFPFVLTCESTNDLNSDDFKSEKFVVSGDKIFKYVSDEFEYEELIEVSIKRIKWEFNNGFLF